MPKRGEQFGRYVLVEELGKGGNGVVWRAKGPDGEVAVKFLRPRSPLDASPRFQREIRTLDRLRGVKGVLPILDSDESAGGPQAEWFAMSLAIPLQEKLGQSASLTDVLGSIRGIAVALTRVHSEGIAHRDIKPENLYWHEGGWCLGDFGLAFFAEDSRLTTDDKKLGPIYYIAPEMLNSPTTADGKRADIYSLGKVLWVLASGQRYPMPGEHNPSVPGHGLAGLLADPRAVGADEVIRAMTRLDPERRLAATEVVRELDSLLRESSPNKSTEGLAGALQALRSAAATHISRTESRVLSERRVNDLLIPLHEGVLSIAKQITDHSQLPSGDWRAIPRYWEYHVDTRSKQILHQRVTGRRFVAGGAAFQWQLGVGGIVTLLSDDLVYVCGGFALDRLLAGNRQSNAPIRGKVPAYKSGEARIWMPSASELVSQIVASLQENLSEVLVEYAGLVASVSK